MTTSSTSSVASASVLASSISEIASIGNSYLPRTLLITGLGGLVAGFFIGRVIRRVIGAITGSTAGAGAGAVGRRESGDEDGEDAGFNQTLMRANANTSEECKLVLVVRTDLGMTKGKIAAQCSHATLACYKALQKSSSSSSSQQMLQKWERYGQAKVVVQVKSEEELEMLQAQAMSLGLVARIVHDAGRTQIASGSATVLGVGPGPKSVVDGVTGDLRLL